MYIVIYVYVRYPALTRSHTTPSLTSWFRSSSPISSPTSCLPWYQSLATLAALGFLAALPGAARGTGVVSCVETDAVDTKKSRLGSKLLNQYRLGDVEWVSIDAIITDPTNRDGECIKLDDALAKGEAIEAQGFDFSKVRMVCVQMPHGETARDHIFDTNETWKRDDPRFPLFDRQRIEYSCVGGNHLLTFLKMLAQQTSCESFVSIVPKNGETPSMSLSVMEKSDKQFHDAATKKVPCIILKREAREEEDALHNIQLSENAGHGLCTLQSDKQCMLRIAKATLAPGYDASVRDLQVIPQLKREFPHLSEHVIDYATFVTAIGGGGSPHWGYYKIADARFGSNKAALRGSLLAAVAKLPAKHPLLMRAIAIAARCLPVGFPRTDNSTPVDWFTKVDITNATSDCDKMADAEDVLMTMHDYIREKIVDEHNNMIFRCRADCRVARLLTNKKHKMFRSFQDFTSVFDELKYEVTEFIANGRVKARSATEFDATTQAQVSMTTWVYVRTRTHIYVRTYTIRIYILYTYVYKYVRTYVFVYAHIYIYVRTYVYIYIYVHTHTYTYMYIYTCTYIRIYACVYVYVYVYIRIYIYICMRIRMYTYVRIYIYIRKYIYTYIYIYIRICTYTYVCMSTHSCIHINTYVRTHISAKLFAHQAQSSLQVQAICSVVFKITSIYMYMLYLYVHAYIYVRICIYVYMYTYIYIYIRIYKHVLTYGCTMLFRLDQPYQIVAC